MLIRNVPSGLGTNSTGAPYAELKSCIPTLSKSSATCFSISCLWDIRSQKAGRFGEVEPASNSMQGGTVFADAPNFGSLNTVDYLSSSTFNRSDRSVLEVFLRPLSSFFCRTCAITKNGSRHPGFGPCLRMCPTCTADNTLGNKACSTSCALGSNRLGLLS
jgi:hypothetical protein